MYFLMKFVLTVQVKSMDHRYASTLEQLEGVLVETPADFRTQKEGPPSQEGNPFQKDLTIVLEVREFFLFLIG